MTDFDIQKAGPGAGAGNSFRQRGLIFFIYLLLGPLIGGALTMVGIISYDVIQEGADIFLDGSLSDVFGLLLMPLFGYLFGGVPAAITGLLIAIFADRNGRFGYSLAFLAAFGPSLAGAVMIADEAIGFAVILLVVGLLASLALRFLFRRRFGQA